MSSPKTVDIVVPCFNPRSGWETILSESVTKLKNGLPEGALGLVILVNDGSTSGISEDVVAQLMARTPELKLIEYPKNMGKGYAVRMGIRSSEADLQIYTDVDFPYVETSIFEFYGVLSENETDVVVASRGQTYYDSLSAFRRILSKSLRWLNGLLFGLKIKDTQGGLKGFNAAGREVFLQTRVNRYLFDLEFIQQASKVGLRLKAIDVKLKPDIILPSPSPTILLKELNNFVRLLFSR
ncbi:MAG: glycosyltransferase family 2 protein [Flavobacteriales bacterium]|nr:glycosyltransferase family 2 protein [Flavobacteriales bacterium]